MTSGTTETVEMAIKQKGSAIVRAERLIDAFTKQEASVER
jgi:hypothetical protein